ncbi:MAG: M14 family metallopeptidase [Pseudobdellovibrionaceae bacterium]
MSHHQSYWSSLLFSRRVLSFILAIICLSVHSVSRSTQLSEKLYWMKLSAKDKFERTVLSEMGVAIDWMDEESVITIGHADLLLKMQKENKVISFYEINPARDFPVQDSNYHNYDELTKALIQMHLNNPDITALDSIGQTVEGRDIWRMRVSGNLPEASNLPAVLFVGGHHAREHLSVEVPLNAILYLLNEYRNGNEKIVNLINSRDLHFIPALNADGLEYDVASGSYKTWRKNRRPNSNGTFGVDLNRNYGFGWGTGGSSKSPNDDTYMGPSAFSEPETQAIRDYVKTNTNITTLLSFHTFSELILYPWGGKSEGIANSQDRAVFEKMAQTMAKWNNYKPMQASGLYIASGDTCDWAYGELKIFCFTFELDPKQSWGSAGFYPGDEVIPQVVTKNLNPILYLIENAGNPYGVLSY